MTQIHREIMPLPYYGLANGPFEWPEIDWVRELGNDVYFGLFLRLPMQNRIVLPPGHRLYVLSFHYEPFDTEWLEQQFKLIDAPIIILNDGEFYNFPTPSNVKIYNYYSWQQHIDQIIEWFPNRQPRHVTHKISGLCNRITQSKLIVFTALLEYLGETECLVKLSEWLEEKNVHYRNPSGNLMLDNLSATFYNKYLGRTYKVDEFNNAQDNIQSINGNPWNPFYLNSALHFTNESYHYSLMSNGSENMIRPGPHMTEKTFKCLIAGTPFIPVGQFRTYANLVKLGLEFDYGIDLTWDEDPGNLSRLVGIVNMIQSLTNYTKEDLVEMTRASTDHNTDMIWSGEFQRRARRHNDTIRDQILKEYL
jgi:hypothetical protein